MADEAGSFGHEEVKTSHVHLSVGGRKEDVIRSEGVRCEG